MIQDELDVMRDNIGIELRGLNKVDKFLLAKQSRDINCKLKHIITEIIKDTNILIKAVIVYVGKLIGLKARESKNKKESEPCWKKKIKKR